MIPKSYRRKHTSKLILQSQYHLGTKTSKDITKKGNNTSKLSCNNTRDDFTHEHHQMVNNDFRLIIFLAAKNVEALYDQQKQDPEMTLAQIMNSLLQNLGLS